MKRMQIFSKSHLLIQQTFPRMQEPLGRPPNSEQTDPGAQIPASPLGEVQASKLANGPLKSGFTETGIRLAKLEKSLHVLAGVNRLLKMPVLIKLAPKLPRAKRPSTWLFSSSALPISNDINQHFKIKKFFFFQYYKII
jgi:hypothetical protein